MFEILEENKNKSSKDGDDREYRKRFFGAIPIYEKNKNSPDPKRRELSRYAANIVADGFIKYSGDKVGEITLGVVLDDVVKHPELVDIITNKAKDAGVKFSLGKNTKKYNLGKNESKGMSSQVER